MQRHLWGVDAAEDAEASAKMLEERGLMHVALLADGSAWALVQPDHLARLQAPPAPPPPLHALRLLQPPPA